MDLVGQVREAFLHDKATVEYPVGEPIEIVYCRRCSWSSSRSFNSVATLAQMMQGHQLELIREAVEAYELSQ